jgi:hypothetical protein
MNDNWGAIRRAKLNAPITCKYDGLLISVTHEIPAIRFVFYIGEYQSF